LSSFTFGWTMMVLGMGVTLITLFLLTIVIRILIKMFPYRENNTRE
jgi:Na+-transporting methylmalonyl-CoA/oxaloacetate decarboxylase gamma subunit